MSELLVNTNLPLLSSLEAELDRKASGGVLAVDRRTGASTAVPPTLPARIERPSDLGSELMLVFSFEGTLKAAAAARLGLDYQWVREVAAGKISGDLGLELDAGAEATLDFALSGRYLGAVWLDDGRLRFKLEKSRRAATGVTGGLTLGARARTPLPERFDELAAAILGVHEGQWLRELAEKAAGGRAAEAVTRFFEQWGKLESRAAAAIWKAAGDSSEFAALRDWIHRIATELRDQEAFRTALAKAMQAAPGFAGSTAGRWIEAAAGDLLSAATKLPEFQRLLAEADAADALLNREDLAGTLRELKSFASRELGFQRVEQALRDSAGLAGLDEWARKRLGEFLGGAEKAAESLRATLDLGAAVYQKALTALEKKYSAELGFRWHSASQDTALLDCSFDFSAEGLRAYREALEGNFSPALTAEGGHVRIHEGVLTHGLRRHVLVELRLPFLDRKQWVTRLEALASLTVEATEDGRLFAYSVAASDQIQRQNLYQSAMGLSGTLAVGAARNEPRFSLSYNDRRKLSRVQALPALAPLLRAYGFDEKADRWLEEALADGEEVEASLSLSAPGEMAAAWLEAPGERDPKARQVYTEVSVAVQQAMRKWLPYVYFSDLNRYDTLGAAYPLVVYACTLPFRSRDKNEFAYDVMSQESTAMARRSTSWALGPELERIEKLLIAAGKADTARYYKPSRKDVILASVARNPRLINALLLADALFVDNLIRLGANAGRLRKKLASDPQRAVKDLAKFAGELVTAFHRKLRRLYGGQDFVAFGSLVLVEATGALNRALKAQGMVPGVLRLSVTRTGSAEPVEQTFVNESFQP